MAYEWDAAFRDKYQRIAAEQTQLAADMTAGMVNEDDATIRHCTDRILYLDGELEKLQRREQGFIQQQQQRAYQANPYGLSETEVEIAKNSHTMRGVSEEDKIRDYAKNRDKLRHWRATGQYRDDQGRR